jgi:hypothetical protein
VSGAGRGRSDAGGATRRSGSRRIGWRAARRLVDGAVTGQDADDLRTLLSLASAPSTAASADSARLGLVLAAYREAAYAPPPPPTGGAPVRQRSATHVLAARCAVVALLLSGAGVTAASTGMLPRPIQRIAHQWFGGEGIPAPSGSGAAGDAALSASSSPSGQQTSTTPMPTPGAMASNALSTLCAVVSAAPKDWQDQLDAADQATLITAAGGQQKVKQYCTKLLAQATESAASSSAAASTSATPSADATTTHGNAHATHTSSPNPHSTGH